MFTLVFLLCNSVTCMSASPPIVFPTKNHCEEAGYAMLEEGKRQVESGEMEPHDATFMCVKQGKPV